MKRIISLIIVVCALFALVSCGDKKAYEADTKSFSKSGITLTLTEAFEEGSKEGYAAFYSSDDVLVFMLKETFDSFTNKKLTLAKYAEFVKEANEDKSPSDVINENGLTYLEYSVKNAASGKTYKYFTAVFEGTDAFWCVQFVCFESAYAEYKPYFINWAKTVTFAPKA